MKREYKLATGGEKYLMMGIARNYPSSTFKVFNVSIVKIVIIHQNVSWHPETPEVRGIVDQAAASGGEQ